MRKIAFFGAGRMASAMVNGILENGLYLPTEIICTSALDGTGETLSSKTGIGLTYAITELLKEVDILVLAIKPQQLKELSPQSTELTKGKLILSIMAGIPLRSLKAIFPKACNIVRSMPNTPGQIGLGITAYASLGPMDEAQAAMVEGILSSLGKVVTIEEYQLDAVTGLSGIGPAYLFVFPALARLPTCGG